MDKRDQENIAYLIAGVMFGVLGNLWVYFFTKILEPANNAIPESYIAQFIVISIAFFSMVYFFIRKLTIREAKATNRKNQKKSHSEGENIRKKPHSIFRLFNIIKDCSPFFSAIAAILLVIVTSMYTSYTSEMSTQMRIQNNDIIKQIQILENQTNLSIEHFEKTNRPFLYIDGITSPINPLLGIRFDFNNAGNLPAAFNISYSNLSGKPPGEQCDGAKVINNSLNYTNYTSYVFPHDNKAYFGATFDDTGIKKCKSLDFNINITFWPLNLEGKIYHINYTLVYQKDEISDNFNFGYTRIEYAN